MCEIILLLRSADNSPVHPQSDLPQRLGYYLLYKEKEEKRNIFPSEEAQSVYKCSSYAEKKGLDVFSPTLPPGGLSGLGHLASLPASVHSVVHQIACEPCPGNMPAQCFSSCGSQTTCISIIWRAGERHRFSA